PRSPPPFHSMFRHFACFFMRTPLQVRQRCNRAFDDTSKRFSASSKQRLVPYQSMTAKPVTYRASLDQARSIQEIQASKPPFVLYHYTTRNALLGMLTTGRLHASHILYLNDHKEFSYA